MDYSVMFSDTGTNRHDDHLSNTVYFPFSPFLSSFHVVSASLCHKVLGLTAYGMRTEEKETLPSGHPQHKQVWYVPALATAVLFYGEG